MVFIKTILGKDRPTPDYDIYLEHFGITQDYRTPGFSKIEEAKYVEGIHWKRKLHQENNTTLIETYSYLNKDGVLLKVLKQLLQKQGVQFNTIDLRVVYKRIELLQNEKRQFKELKKLINSFITLFKSNGFTEKDFVRIETQIPLIKSHFIQERNLVNHLIGFPNKISDDPVLSYVLTNTDQFPYSEERRLFYVALRTIRI
ncbi:hypothetical protein ACQKNX_06710 [Lysinibacillus sp. NPDC093712]|uniref:hypothetical protein n=1 Tax=Lysinibacillus sp. NPDC093712 TaxID=3390579 RepID=UPI003D02596F